MTEIIERMAKLFRGLDRAHGTFKITGQKDNGKYEGKAYTVREPYTIEHWQEHVEGERSLGIIPIDDEGFVYWGAIDIDVYPLDINELQALILKINLPLIVVESKSGGAHLYLFMKEKVTAAWMVATLKKWAKLLGYPATEIFPKQIKLANKDDCGNWLNMPYFGDTRKMFPNQNIDYFLDFAEAMSQSQSQVDSMEVEEEETNPMLEMPPCLQVIATDGAPEGTRNKVMYNYGIFLKQAYPADELEGRMHEANRTILSEPIEPHEVSSIRASIEKKDGYFYQCSEEPLCSNCDKPVCKTRKYGVGGEGGGGTLTVTFNGLSKLLTDPVIWYLDVDGYRVEIPTASLFSFPAIKQRCAEVLTKHIGHMKAGDWEQLVSTMLENCDEVAMPEESGTLGSFKSHLNDFLTGGKASDTRDALLTGRPWLNSADNRYYFRSSDLGSHLDNRKFRDYTTAQIGSKLKSLGADHGQFNLKGACVRWWAISPLYASQTEDFTVEVPELPMQ